MNRKNPMNTTAPQPRRLVQALAGAFMLTGGLAGGWIGVPVCAQTLPTGMTVAAGQAAATLSGNTLTVRNTPDTILNWNSFSIGAGNAVRFEQAGASSQVLNRVTGNEASAILGSLSSNGRVWLLNPNGVLFGQGARVDVAGLVVSTLGLGNQDWLAGRYLFSATPGQPGTLVNEGELRSSLGGQIVLLGATVSNKGVIDAPGGQVLLAAGEQIELIDTGAPNLSVRVAATPGEVVNFGRLSAAGGHIDVHAASVNQQGLVQADALELGPAGQIVLSASQDLQLGATSQTRADGATGGRLLLDGGNNTRVSGVVSAQGRDGQGGQVTVLGNDIRLLDGALIDVSGSSGGGQALIGGGAQGQDPSVRNARSLSMASLARVRADATLRGDGGRIVMWSNASTRVHGQLSARGGTYGGAGGWIETSGGWLDAQPGLLDVAAPLGRAGVWLLDPYNILISDTRPANAGTTGGSFNVDANLAATGNDAWISSATLQSALSRGTRVVISTTAAAGGGSQAGDITVSNANINVAVNGTTPGSLTLLADRDIVFSNSNIFSSSLTTPPTPSAAALPVTLTAGRAGLGAVVLDRSSISTQGGAITINGAGQGLDPTGQVQLSATGHAGNPNGVLLSSSRLDVGTGQISINGMGSATATAGASRQAGVRLDNSFLLGGDIALHGAGRAGDGVVISDSELHASRSIALSGRGNATGVSILGRSWLDLSAASATTPATLTIGGRSDGALQGVLINSIAATSPDLNPAVTLQLDNGGTVRISAGNDGSAGASAALELSAGTTPLASISVGGTASSSVRLDTAYGGKGMRLASAQITASNASVTLDGRGLADLGSSSIRTGGAIRLLADDVRLSGNTVLGSTAAGDAIVLAGPGAAGAMASFVNQAGAAVLQTSAANKGRWVVYNADSSASRHSPGGLKGDFTRYGAAFGAWSASAGSGFAFAAAEPVAAPLVPAGEPAVPIAPPLKPRTTVLPQSPPSWGLGGLLDVVQTGGASDPPAGKGAGSNSLAGISPLLPGRSLAQISALTGEGGETAPAGTTGSSRATASDFGELAIGSMSYDALQGLLAARDRYKKILFEEALGELERNPALADLRLCRNVQEAEEGVCLMSEPLRRQLQTPPVQLVPSAPLAQRPLVEPPPARPATPAAQVRPPVPVPSMPPVRPATPAMSDGLPAVAPSRLAFDLLGTRLHRIRTAALPQIRRKIALVVGVDQYDDARIPPLANAVSDARAVGRVFEKQLGYETVVLENASKAAVVRALNRLVVEMSPNDSVIVYYAGHGAIVESTGAGYWQLADSDAKTPRSWLANADISRLVGQISASQVALISDSCYSGSLLSGERIRPLPGKPDPEPLLARKAVVVMSSGGNEPVFDEGKQGHSLFAWNLMKALGLVSSWQPGGNVFERVRFAVARELPQRPHYGASTVAGHQGGTDYLFELRQIEFAD